MKTKSTKKIILSLSSAAVLVLIAIAAIWDENGGGGDLSSPPVQISIAEAFTVPAADAQTQAIVTAAKSFLALLDESQRQTVIFPFEDNAQRAKWSNFPHPYVTRRGIRRGDMSQEQLSALDNLLQQVMSGDGFRNIEYQLEADNASGNYDKQSNFSEANYFVSFLGAPSLNQPWMLQFGGHHLAINATVFGPDISFSPMLTGGEPLNITFKGEKIFITEAEVLAAQALLESLSDDQKTLAVRSNRKTRLLLGPGQHGVTPAPEGISGADLTPEQRSLFLKLISERLGFINQDDFFSKMKIVQAELEQTWFGWWGPQDQPGTAYYRITGPSLIIEYSPEGSSNSNDHAHNMYRDPSNDYGSSWISK
ncbi:DUF3500 domain-containing protein [Pelagicoccus albus]|uniref:DUF3500 domain-containing protein n=1 Tax=Pelagicoccus albus TaxID=415222 RepID=A0A7X1B7M3_9BACT|nr:DUF3500 domain-containing protein [Pelagicoccus albus]MBC2607052.1 DUF3500 domain-containing protein [Pelagicoccus albus]